MTSEHEDEAMARFDHGRPISAPVHPSKPKSTTRLLSFLLQALVMAVALSLFFLFTGVAAILLLLLAGTALRRRRRPDPAAASGIGTCLSLKDLQGLPFFQYSRHVAVSDCAVCLEGFRSGDPCRALPGCGHVFHSPCVDRWLMRSPVCPICRREVAAVVPDRTVGRSFGRV